MHLALHFILVEEIFCSSWKEEFKNYRDIMSIML